MKTNNQTIVLKTFVLRTSTEDELEDELEEREDDRESLWAHCGIRAAH